MSSVILYNGWIEINQWNGALLLSDAYIYEWIDLKVLL